MQPSQLNYLQTRDFLANSVTPPTDRITTFQTGTMSTTPISNLQLDVLPMDPDDYPMDIPLTQYYLRVSDIKTFAHMSELNRIHLYFNGASPGSTEIYEFSAVFSECNQDNPFYFLDLLKNIHDSQFSSYDRLTGNVFFATLNFRDNDGYPEYFFEEFERVIIH
jgi:hypothetical protein